MGPSTAFGLTAIFAVLAFALGRAMTRYVAASAPSSQPARRTAAGRVALLGVVATLFAAPLDFIVGFPPERVTITLGPLLFFPIALGTLLTGLRLTFAATTLARERKRARGIRALYHHLGHHLLVTVLYLGLLAAPSLRPHGWLLGLMVLAGAAHIVLLASAWWLRMEFARRIEFGTPTSL